MANHSEDGDRKQFDPGPSFTDDDPGSPPMSELPSWLQSFAASVEDDDSEAPAEAPAMDADAGPDSPVADASADNPAMPGWLNAPHRDAPSGGNADASVGTGFFSEDDLPEWLRALNSDREPAVVEKFAGDEGAPEPPAATTRTRVLTAPAVSTVWVTGMEERVENPGASLFAFIATGGESRPELPLATAARASQAAAERPAASHVDDAWSDGQPRQGSWSRRERTLMIAVIIMGIVMLLLLNGNFGS
ncbi:MAG TPA: hypothetical protein VMM78_09695 [Thermomicrobiales bacterium]|nr:hypothetical protein [Thermomicrobiales bacterium]